MKNIVFILISLLTGFVAFPQNVNIQQADSLRHELAEAKQDTSRAIILADLAEAYRTEKPDSTLYFAAIGMKVEAKEGEGSEFSILLPYS